MTCLMAGWHSHHSEKFVELYVSRKDYLEKLLFS
jgi:hypothetical protein